MLENYPFLIVLKTLTPADKREVARHYRDLADWLDFDANRREPATKRELELKDRVARVKSAARAVVTAVASREPLEIAVELEAKAQGVDEAAVRAALTGARRELREAEDQRQRTLARTRPHSSPRGTRTA